MIQIPEDGWGFGPASDDPGTLLNGRAAPLDDGYLTIPADGWGMVQPTPDDDPVTRADSMKDRAQRALDLMHATTAANRELDTLVTGIVDGPDWREGLSRFDKGVAALRQTHLPSLKGLDAEDAFDRDLDEFAGMRRIGLKRALVEKQQSEALTALDETLDYYAGEAATAGHDVFREIAVDRGLKAIQAMREAGYLFPESAAKLEASFRSRIEGNDLERIAQADPEGALAVLNDARLFPNAAGDLREKLIQSLSGKPPVRDSDDIAGMLAPLVENNDGLRDLLEALRENPDDPGSLIQLANNLLDGNVVFPEANKSKLQLLQELLRWGSNQLKRRPRDLEGEKPPQLPPPKPGSEEPKPLAPVPPRISRPKADPPIMEPPKEDGTDLAPTYSPTKPIGIGKDRYKRIGNKEFVQYSDGTVDFGRIDSSIAQEAGIREAPVRLPKGNIDGGELHLEIPDRAKQLRKAGYSDAASFVDDVSQHFTEIWEGQGNSLMLVFRPDSDPTANAHTLFISLQPSAAGDAYEVVSGGVFRGQYPAGNKRNLLWHGARSSP